MGWFSFGGGVILGSMKGSVSHGNTVKNPCGLKQCSHSFDLYPKCRLEPDFHVGQASGCRPGPLLPEPLALEP